MLGRFRQDSNGPTSTIWPLSNTDAVLLSIVDYTAEDIVVAFINIIWNAIERDFVFSWVQCSKNFK